MQNIIKLNEDGEETSLSYSSFAALECNIQDSFDEIETLRGTVQYWESRRIAANAKERDLVIEAYRVIHGELLGLTARMKELRDRAETGLEVASLNAS
jgi:hypothetical protein